MSRSIICTVIMCTNALFLFAQKSISGKIIDKTQQPLSFVNIILRNAANNQFLNGVVSELDGSFNLSAVPKGVYTVEAGMVGYEIYKTEQLSLDNQDIKLAPIVLKEKDQELKAVEVSAQKNLYEKQIDRLVVNVKNSLTASGSSALDILERSPGVIVNRQGSSISVLGKDGIVVMINGKIQYMQLAAVMDLLAGMSSSNIEKIEIINNPPASFDAEGNAGFINIVMIKNENEGINGNFAVTAGGYKGLAGNAAMNIAYNKGKFSLFSDFNYLHNSQSQSFNFTRSVPLNGEFFYTETENIRLPQRNNNSLRIGTEYRLKSTTFSAIINGYHNVWEMDANGLSQINKDNSAYNRITTKTIEVNKWIHGGANFSIVHNFKDKSSLTLNADYLQYYTDNPSTYENEYLKIINTAESPESVRVNKETPIQISVGKLDYSRSLGKKTSFEAGLKQSIATFENDILVENFVQNQWQKQGNFSSYAQMNEQISAIYSSINHTINEKNTIKAGLRYEYTHSKLDDIDGKPIVDRKYGYFFPSVFYSYTINKKSNIGLALVRRITRPTFNDLAPFVIFTDPTSFVTGNPKLLPVLSSSVKMDYKYNSLLWSVQYGVDKNPVARFLPVVTKNTNTVTAQVQNFDNLSTLSASFSMPFTLKKWWTGNLNMTGLIQKIEGIYQENKVSVNQNSANMFLSQNFKLNKGFGIELSGFGNTGGFFGPFRNKPFGSVNFAIQKKFDNKATLTIGADNFLGTLRFRSSFNDPILLQSFSNDMIFVRPTGKITYRQGFGNQKLKVNSNRQTGASEERKRID